MNRFLSFVNDIIFKNEQTKRILERPNADMYYIHELCSTVCKLRHDVGSQHVIENVCSETRFAEVLPGN